MNGQANLDGPNHHKMMRKELIMNIFPFGNEGTDPSTVIKLVNDLHYNSFIINSEKNHDFLLKFISVNKANKFTRCWY